MLSRTRTRTQGIFGVALIAALCLFTAACSDEGGGAPPWAGGPGGGGAAPSGPQAVVGTWHVVTILVAAQDATNPKYKPGDLREEKWRITQSQGALVLKTPAGSLPGQAQGSGYVFEGVSETGLNLRIRVRIEARLTSARTMIGTIKAWYHGTFNNLGGIDAWSFEATR